MRTIEKDIKDTHVKINRNQISNTTEYFNELMSQFYLDCSPEDIKKYPEAKKCLRRLKSLGRQIKSVNRAEKRLFGI